MRRFGNRIFLYFEGNLELTLIASIAYSTWKMRPSGEKVFTPLSYSERVRNISVGKFAVLYEFSSKKLNVRSTVAPVYLCSIVPEEKNLYACVVNRDYFDRIKGNALSASCKMTGGRGDQVQRRGGNRDGPRGGVTKGEGRASEKKTRNNDQVDVLLSALITPFSDLHGYPTNPILGHYVC